MERVQITERGTEGDDGEGEGGGVVESEGVV